MIEERESFPVALPNPGAPGPGMPQRVAPSLRSIAGGP